jgi:hypothetical protein
VLNRPKNGGLRPGQFGISDAAVLAALRDGPGGRVGVVEVARDGPNPVAIAARAEGFSEPTYMAVARVDLRAGQILGAFKRVGLVRPPGAAVSPRVVFFLSRGQVSSGGT